MSFDEKGDYPLAEGAAEGAPTAPHATPRASQGKRTGPERFWLRRPVSVGLLVGLAVSAAVHSAAFPIEWPTGMEINDVDGEAAIAVDLLSEPAPSSAPSSEPAEPPPAPPIATASPTETAALPDAGARAAPREVFDAAADASGDAMTPDAAPKASPPVVTGEADAGFDAGAGDTQAIAGAVGSVQADVVLVVVLVNAEVVRKNPVGATLGVLLRGIPQWEDFMSGTDIDPVRDTDWLMISGPSLVNTGRDVVLIRYGATDAAVDRAVALVSRNHAGGGPFDAGVPGVKATLAHADRADRVLLRPSPHVLAVVPPAIAAKEARELASLRLPAHVRPGEAVYFRMETPHRAMPEIPESISEVRLRVVPRPDGGADAFLEADTKDQGEAALAAPEVAAIIRRRNSTLISLFTHGLLDRVEVRSEGPKVLVHLLATSDDLQTLAALAASFLGVSLPDMPAGGSAGSSPSPSVARPAPSSW
jgi:hypothetical protein